MRVIEDMYDARFVHEKNHSARREEKLQRAKASNTFDSSIEDDAFGNYFPVFVVQRLTTVVGLKSLTDQIGWDLLCNIDRNYKAYAEVETFKHFLQEKFNDDDLLFFLYVRSIIAKMLRVNFSSRWILVHGADRQPKALFLTFSECVQVSHKIFGKNCSKIRKQYIASIIASKKLVGVVNKKEDTRKIDVRDILHLSTMNFRRSQSGLDMLSERNYEALTDNDNGNNKWSETYRNRNDKIRNDSADKRKNTPDHMRNQSTDHMRNQSNNSNGVVTPSNKGFDFTSPNAQHQRKKNVVSTDNTSPTVLANKAGNHGRNRTDHTWTDSDKNGQGKDGVSTDQSPMYTPGMSITEDDHSGSEEVDFTWSEAFKKVRDGNITSTDDSPCYTSRLTGNNIQPEGIDFTWSQAFINEKNNDIIETCESPGKKSRMLKKSDHYFKKENYGSASNDDIDFSYNEAFKDIMGSDDVRGQSPSRRSKSTENNNLNKEDKDSSKNGKMKNEKKIEKSESFDNFSYNEAFKNSSEKDIVRGKSPARVRNSQIPSPRQREIIVANFENSRDDDFSYSEAFKEGSGKGTIRGVSPARLRQPHTISEKSSKNIQKSLDQNENENDNENQDKTAFTYSQAFKDVRNRDDVRTSRSPARGTSPNTLPDKLKNSSRTDVGYDSESNSDKDDKKKKKKVEKGEKSDRRRSVEGTTNVEKGEIRGRGRGVNSENGRRNDADSAERVGYSDYASIRSRHDNNSSSPNNRRSEKIRKEDNVYSNKESMSLSRSGTRNDDNEYYSHKSSVENRDNDNCEETEAKRRKSTSSGSTGKTPKRKSDSNKRNKDKSRRVTVSPKVCLCVCLSVFLPMF